VPLLSEIIDIDKAKALFQDRRPAEVQASTEFYNGDHWQDGGGWIGAAPTFGTTAYKQTLAQIQEAFVSENVIGEVVDRHVAGVLGREPLWGFIPQDMVALSTRARRQRFQKRAGITTVPAVPAEMDPAAQEADDALTLWWNQRRTREQMKQALKMALAEGVALLRFFIPRGLRDENGSIPDQSDLSSALDSVYLQVVTADKGGVFKDDDTEREFGIYLYERDGENFAELSFVNQAGQTQIEILSDDGNEGPFVYDLQGRLTMYEFRRQPLITEQVKSNQRSLNLALTMMMRNVNLAGSLERTVMNAERPKKKIRVYDEGSPTKYREETVDGDYLEGAGATMFLTGLLVRNDAGQIIQRANPNISFREPVKVETFTATRDQFYASILGQCQQKHAMISGDSTVSGRSREQARGEYESSLKDSADVIDDCGRWALEVPMRLGAQLCNQVNKFAELRCDFTSIIETGPVDPQERVENRADVEARLMSAETAMSRNGIDDTDAELQRIAEQPEPTVQNLPSDKLGEGPGVIA
jgi:hypothetical protein